MNSTNRVSTMATNMDDSMTMSSTFSEWQSYRLHLLFSSWNITNPWEFALSFFAVMAAVVVYHFLEYIIEIFEKGIIEYLKESNTALFNKEKVLTATVENSDESSSLLNYLQHRPRGWTTVKILFGLISAMKYGLTLMLMVVAMTMNPSLFLALFLGYLLGDFLFCDLKWNNMMGAYRSCTHRDGGIVRMILQFALRTSAVPSTTQSLTVPTTDALDQGLAVRSSSNILTGVLWTLPRAISLTYLVVLLVWIVQVEGGFGFDAASIFGWHALLMSFFVAMFTNEALLTYVAPLFPQLANDRMYLKSFHAFSHFMGMASFILGLVAIVAYKDLSNEGVPVVFPYFTMYSPHSWMGVLTLALWTAQLFFSVWLFGLARWAAGSEQSKAQLVSLHHFMGLCSFAMGLATCASGFQDMQSSDLASTEPSSSSLNTTMTMTMMKMNTTTTIAMHSSSNDDTLTSPAMAMGTAPYAPDSTFAQLASACAVLLLALGVSTFAALRFLPRRFSAVGQHNVKQTSHNIPHEEVRDARLALSVVIRGIDAKNDHHLA